MVRTLFRVASVESIAGVPEPDGPYWQTLEEVLAK